MGNITNSATKLVLLYIMFVLGVLALFAGGWGIVQGTLDPKEITSLFGTSVTFLMGYYFSKPNTPTE